MNTAEKLIENMKPAPAISRRVRIVNDPRVQGRVIDICEDGWIFWVGDDLSCHLSKPDYVEAVS